MDRPKNLPGGKPPKSIEQIRSAVESIHRNTATPTRPGPLTEGLAADERVVLATFHDASLCRDFQQRLLAAGVMSSVRKQRRMTLLSVDTADRTRAAELLRVQAVSWSLRAVPPLGKRTFDGFRFEVSAEAAHVAEVVALHRVPLEPGAPKFKRAQPLLELRPLRAGLAYRAFPVS